MMKKIILFLVLTLSLNLQALAGISFDGVDDFVSMGSPTAYQFDTGEAFTISFWAKPSDDIAAGQTQIVGYSEGTTDGWLIVQDNTVSSQCVEFCDYDGFDFVCRRSDAGSFLNGNWY